MKLKTLKDMDTGHKAEITDGKGKIIDRPISSLDLKMEVIKWIKFIESKVKSQEDLFLNEECIWCGEDVGTPSAVIILKHFFNITDKDLEEKWAKKIKKECINW